MAQHYARVLQGLGKPFEVIGRGLESAKKFENETGRRVKTGGLTIALRSGVVPEKAIVAVGIEHLASCTAELISAGVKDILVEKPAGLDLLEIESLGHLADKVGANVLLAYNRRFYESVAQAREFISEDGGILSAQFEFTEWSHVIAPLKKGHGVKERWLLGNSTHVIDLVFHLIGRPIDWNFWSSGSLDWHPSAARFVGAGITEKDVMFTYLADWQAPGRWGIELLTSKRRLIFRPLEKLQVVTLGSLTTEIITPRNGLDRDYKPGLFRLTQAFLDGDEHLFCNLQDQVCNVRTYYKIAGYK